MAYVLGTTSDVVLWYCFGAAARVGQIAVEAGATATLSRELDLRAVTQFADKASAKAAAQALGLKTWRYVRV